jgi:hypothetical protein
MGFRPSEDRQTYAPTVTIGERNVLTATTEQLREFALEHAEDQDAFFRGVGLSAKEIILLLRTPRKIYCASGSPGYCGALFSGQQHFELFSIARRRKTSVAGTDECERFVFWQVREGFAKGKWQ